MEFVVLGKGPQQKLDPLQWDTLYFLQMFLRVMRLLVKSCMILEMSWVWAAKELVYSSKFTCTPGVLIT